MGPAFVVALAATLLGCCEALSLASEPLRRARRGALGTESPTAVSVVVIATVVGLLAMLGAVVYVLSTRRHAKPRQVSFAFTEV